MISKILFCITTYNRKSYLQDCINTFMSTKSDKFIWTIIVADDGSNDGTIEYLESLQLDLPIVIIKNNRNFISRQTNSIFEVCNYLDYDFGFKVDDDVHFADKGWDIDYVNAYVKYGFAHLVHYNPEHLKYKKHVLNGDLFAGCDVRGCMGCLFTFIPEIFKTVGYFDEEKFKTFGHGHQEWTLRCCRAGYNNSTNVYDVKDSYLKVKLKCRQTEKYYVTHKANSNRDNKIKFHDVLNDPKIIKKEHTEKPKNIIIINCGTINKDIEIINKVEYKINPLTNKCKT